MKLENDFIEINKKSWNKRALEHFNNETSFYNVKEFLNGKNSLNSIELNLLGNITGKKILHLQCHFGMDTISLSELGAEVIGVDLADEAIKKAKLLAKQKNTNTKFICCDIFDLPKYLNETFDIIFMSYGVIGWHPDLNKLGELISQFLNKNGKFILVEFHPILFMFDLEFKKIEYAYSRKEAYITIDKSYTDGGREEKEYEEVTWSHGLSEIINGLLNNNLRLLSFTEYDYSPFNLFGNMKEEENGKFMIAGLERKIPILFSIVANNS